LVDVSTYRDVRHLASYAAFRLAIGAFGLLPRGVAIALGERVAGAARVLVKDRRRMAIRHARRLNVDDVESHTRAVFAAYGRYWAETFWVRPRRRAEIEASTVLVGEEIINEALGRGRGLVIALPHLGNWEYAGPLGEKLGFELVAVAENLANRRIRDWFVDLRRRLGIKIVLATGSVAVMRELEKVLGRGGAVALLCDRDLKGRGVEVDFFGERTTLPAGPVSLAQRTGAPLLPAAAYFGPGGTHRVVILTEVPLTGGPDRAEVVATTTQELARRLESLILEAPEQWHMLQPNWPSDRA